MFPKINFVDYVMMLFGALLCFKRVAEMERYHELRVFILTSILGAVVLVFLLSFAFTINNPIEYDYPSADHFTMTE